MKAPLRISAVLSMASLILLGCGQREEAEAPQAVRPVKIFTVEGVDGAAITAMFTSVGIPKQQFNTIFEPGYTTKKRGWGLGLSLAKRIIEDYHEGKIKVKNSTIGKGTTMETVREKFNVSLERKMEISGRSLAMKLSLFRNLSRPPIRH